MIWIKNERDIDETEPRKFHAVVRLMKAVLSIQLAMDFVH